MTILAIETSGAVGGFAVMKGGKLLAETVRDITGTHVEHGTLMVREVLGRASVGMDELEAVAVSLGPGSFTGLRAGMALAKGICMGRAIPLAGVPTLDCIAYALRYWTGIIVPVIDARRGEIYFSAYMGGGSLTRLVDYMALTPVGLVGEVGRLKHGAGILLAGSGIIPYGAELQAGLGRAAFVAPRSLWFARPAVVAKLGAGRVERGETMDYGTAEPMYVRPSEAERRGARGR